MLFLGRFTDDDGLDISTLVLIDLILRWYFLQCVVDSFTEISSSMTIRPLINTSISCCCSFFARDALYTLFLFSNFGSSSSWPLSDSSTIYGYRSMFIEPPFDCWSCCNRSETILSLGSYSDYLFSFCEYNGNYSECSEFYID